MTYLQWLCVATSWAVVGPRLVKQLNASSTPRPGPAEPADFLPSTLLGFIVWLLPVLALPLLGNHAPKDPANWVDTAVAAFLLIAWHQRRFVRSSTSPRLVWRLLDGWNNWLIRGWMLALVTLLFVGLAPEPLTDSRGHSTLRASP